MRELLLSLACAGCLAAPASAVTIDWVTVGNPGNACDTHPRVCFGAVANTYRISKTEVTNAQYTEFLNAVAATDPYSLYDTSMFPGFNFGGIVRSGSSGSYTYSTVGGRGSMPVNHVSFYDPLRFANWLHNGQGSGDTETGAYTLLGGTAIPSNGLTVPRNAGAMIFLPSDDEWYKAAYFDGTSYFDYPAGLDAQIVCAAPGATANTANCIGGPGDLTLVGSYTGSGSPYGTFDQGGNLAEWTELILIGSRRGLHGGSFDSIASFLASPFPSGGHPAVGSVNVGFRVASLPEPGFAVLVVVGMLGVAGWRKRGARPISPCRPFPWRDRGTGLAAPRTSEPKAPHAIAA